ncbi:MAG: ATP-binding cassette domain-containing protein [Candidatus Acidiferrales bacterium]
MSNELPTAGQAPAPKRESSPSSNASVAIEFRDVRFAIKGAAILEGLSFTVLQGETLAVLGRSGSGKTTALKFINRLLQPDSGQVIVQGRSTSDWDPTELRRRIGYVIQEAGLFPHFTIEKNIALVPWLEKWPPQRIAARVEELLRIVGLNDGNFAQRYPHQLSGGQRQRVGVARALAADPPILLMDEPFGALDPLTRMELERHFLELQQLLRKTILFVTHDVREALFLGTRIALLDAGKLVGIYTPDEFQQLPDALPAAYMNAFRSSDRK